MHLLLSDSLQLLWNFEAFMLILAEFRVDLIQNFTKQKEKVQNTKYLVPYEILGLTRLLSKAPLTHAGTV